MGLPTEPTYRLISFADATSARIFADAVKFYLLTVDGERFRRKPRLVEVWGALPLEPAAGAGEVRLFVTDDALLAAAAAGLRVAPSREVGCDELPGRRQELVGVEYERTPQRAHPRLAM